MADEKKKTGKAETHKVHETLKAQDNAAKHDVQEVKKTQDPKLDPLSPEFDKEAWKQANKGKSLNEILMSMNPAWLEQPEQANQAAENVQAMHEAFKAYTEQAAQAAVKAAKQFEQIANSMQPFIEMQNNVASTIQAFTGSIAQLLSVTNIENIRSTIGNIIDSSVEIQERLAVIPFIEAELKKPEYNGVTFEELLRTELGEDGEPLPGSRLEKLIQAAEAAKAASAESKENLPQITVKGKGADNTEYPVDKVNANIWTLLVNAEKNGQLTFAAERSGSKKTADIVYSINFDDLEAAGLNTDKRLTVFDKRVQIAASALYNSTGAIMTISQIYATMGNDSRPNKRDIERIYTSLEKMRLIPISLDNTSEHTLYPNIEKFIYNGVILPWESIDAVVNGQRVEGAIHLFREPPLVSFAKSRKQVTTISRNLLASPISKTEVHLLIDDYLIERISRLKNSHGKVSNKLLYTTIYAKTGITGRMQRSRAKETIIKYLEHYKNCGFINGYKEAADGVNILY